MHNHHHRDPRHGGPWARFEAMGRRGFGGGKFGPGGFGGDFGGDWGRFGDNFRIGRMLASGDLRLVALFLIEEQPRHGYDLIKAIEEKSGGLYSPSPGVIYPALTYLEEAGYVTSSVEGNKKAYTITEDGRTYLGENREAVASTLDFLAKAGQRAKEMREHFEARGGRDRDIPGVLPEVNEARKELKSAIARAVRGGEEQQRRLADILRKAAEEIGKDDVDL
ncbi:PadR family transcriptional regulator [Paradevosia shaoguanensis]|uniref:PadR family transcriptional regulator n=1 Tax=Paradevosia shaoguanensis TaxID=1335043 RepID=A0AA41QSV0_9HYPH|nr:PadR family transcriptional regulator [Paradevosia shaoguanensis]MBI4047063.1 PadR family transcriptional regulator [Devosia nanyangense]MCF1744886.1 PadR family transcriptional regulator [Paradevosia shaoguanensis]MCI0129369.1 PadR family transcriptional regulator [Paradevosia shaoguanensis]QMV00452.1 PadR family transcriptional regulator [Devosia sp. D6-9]